ncbi:uncharacterized protein [Arachis hypogaea]|uniref:uncharacterized protein n=1 Tax=Arachis hypogaea TaxID=3818 RepID=UPI000DED02DD|nr:uncharacterized protein LOC112755923 [Arachis hypogaea]
MMQQHYPILSNPSSHLHPIPLRWPEVRPASSQPTSFTKPASFTSHLATVFHRAHVASTSLFAVAHLAGSPLRPLLTSPSLTFLPRHLSAFKIGGYLWRPRSPIPDARCGDGAGADYGLRLFTKECIVIMVQWQRHFLPVFRQIAHSATTSSPQGKGLTTLTARTILLPSISSRSPVYHSFQYQGISGSTCLLSKSSDLEQTPTSSPLALTSFLGSKEAQDQKQTPVKKERVQAVMSKIKQSPKKVNLVAALVRGMLVKDALLQLQVTVKRASRTVYQGITQAQGNAVNNHGLDAERLIVAEAFVGKGLFRKKVSYHSKGRAGIKVKPECRLTVVVREITAEEEAKIARLKVHNFRKLTKREKRLVPHQLIVSNPVWGRKNKSSDRNSSATAA